MAHPPPYPPPQGGRGNSLAGIDRPSPLEGEGQGGGSLLDVPEQGGRENQFRRVPEPGLVDVENLGTLASGLRDAGRQEIAWDGRMERGEPAPSGIYFVRVEAGGVTHSSKLVLTR